MRWTVRAIAGLTCTAVSALLLGSGVAAAQAGPVPVPVPAAGSFTVALAQEPPQARPIFGGLCELRVNGSLTFTGTLDGVATGTTTALVFAPCDEVLRQPFGTFADVFRSEARFAGTVAGQPATATLVYTGVSAAGGDIQAAIVLEGGARAALRVEARLADGGSYTGIAAA